MSIDARIETIIVNEDGSGELRLIDRPARTGGVSGIRGQATLFFDTAPEEVTALNGLDIWGGSGSIVLGNKKIADRTGYAAITFVDRPSFLEALKVRRIAVKMVGMTHPRTRQCGTAYGRSDGLWEFPDGTVVDDAGNQMNQTPVKGGLIGCAGVEPTGSITWCGPGSESSGWVWLLVMAIIYLLSRMN